MGVHITFDPDELNFLNNFFTRFPLGIEPYLHKYPEGLYRYTMSGIAWKKTKRVSLKELVGEVFRDEADLLDHCEAYSDKYLDQTPAEFCAEINLVMNELGISVQEITRYLNIKVHEQKIGLPEDTPFVDDLNLPLRPIYQALRERGYNKKDLWA